MTGTAQLEAPTPSRQWPFVPIVAASAWIALVIFATVAGSTGPAGTTCIFKRVTGEPCPTCAGTRATLALASGHPIHAFVLNPLVTIAILAGVVWLGLSIANRRPLGAPSLHQRRVWLILVAAVATNWAYLLITGHA